MAEVDHFVHEETERDRKSLQWSKPDPQLISELSVSDLPYFVVDFHSFWPGYSATAYIYVVQKGNEFISLRSITVKSPRASGIHRSLISAEASIKPLGNGNYLYRYRALDMKSSDYFSGADSLTVTIKWLEQDEIERSATFNLKKQTKKTIAWLT
ncbi:hypothetical protein ACJJH9_09465 [Microbulbifer sp. DLAB2-AF]|uniref:hypothetical protein n=1 Tax=Microbulbifer sp. DLAB2-AF TaxID=3243395 RepID=UPI00403A2399